MHINECHKNEPFHTSINTSIHSLGRLTEITQYHICEIIPGDGQLCGDVFIWQDAVYFLITKK